MLSFSAFLSRQLRRPSGFFGRHLLTRMFNRGNRELIAATLAQLELRPEHRYLDLGFGGGLALRLAAEQAQGALYGVDYSSDVVAQGERSLGDLVAAGRLTLLQGDVGDMPLADGVVDRISTMNTLYFWPQPQRGASELFRLLAPGGRLALGFASGEKLATHPVELQDFQRYEPEQVAQLLREAGFIGVRLRALSGRRLSGLFVAVGERP